jgi:hypothetical protein
MATTQTFANMINEYLPNKLLMEELKKRNWLLQNIEHDKGWKLGNLIVSFVSAPASSTRFGDLTTASDIAKESTVRGVVSAHKEMWSSLLFEAKDLMVNDKVSEQNFLRILPDQINRHMDYVNQVLGQNIINGTAVDKAVANGTVGGILKVSNPERFVLGMKVQVDDDDSAPVTGYIRFINMNTDELTIYDARSGGAVVDLSAYTVSQNAKVYADQQQSNGFTSLLSGILPLSAGGSATLYGVTKTDTPFTQSIAIDGSASGLNVTAATLLDNIFKAYVLIRKKGQGKPFKALMSYRNYGVCIQNLKSLTGAFNVIPQSEKINNYGWTEIQVGGYAGVVTIVALQEMNDTEVIFFDSSSAKMYSNGGLRKQKSPEGLEYFTVRNTSGYQYIVDMSLMGEFVLQEPSKNGVLYGLSLTY